MIWPPKMVKDSGSLLHSKLKEAIMQEDEKTQYLELLGKVVELEEELTIHEQFCYKQREGHDKLLLKFAREKVRVDGLEQDVTEKKSIVETYKSLAKNIRQPMCFLCTEAPIAMLYLPCRHFGVCRTCAEKWRTKTKRDELQRARLEEREPELPVTVKCPFCRTSVAEEVHTYLD